MLGREAELLLGSVDTVAGSSWKPFYRRNLAWRSTRQISQSLVQANVDLGIGPTKLYILPNPEI